MIRPLLRRGFALWQTFTAALDGTQALAALLARVYIAQVFFLSGLTKIRDWDTTLLLFTEEYQVPLLSPEVAAIMGTTGELVLPLLLLSGLAGRFAALGLGVVNGIAVLSLSEIAPAALQQHITWGVLLAALALYGVGRWSVDCVWLKPRLEPWLALRGARHGSMN